MDEAAEFNRSRWNNLVEANALFTRPMLDLTRESAQICADEEGLFGDLNGKKVLCLASGGGQQSVAFALLGANVTVFDLSEKQLERDRQAALHYGLEIEIVQGDMRDLSIFQDSGFDIVYQPYSIGFVPDATVVFKEVAKKLRSGGVYYFAIGNPFYAGLSQADWDGAGYALKRAYLDGELVVTPDPDWVYAEGSGERIRKTSEVREYRQNFARIMNSLISLGFQLIQVSDSKHQNPDPEASPGTWEHFTSIAPPWLNFWLIYSPS